MWRFIHRPDAKQTAFFVRKDMALQVDYNNSTLTQRMIAVGGCLFGGAIVLILGLCGAFGDYETLPLYGFNLWTVPFYAIVVACGFLTLFRFKYAVIGAIASIIIEFVLYICVQLSTTPEVGFLILLKLAVLVCCTQLAISIVSFEEDDGEEPVPQPRHHAGALPPQARRNTYQAPVGRNQAPVGRNQAPVGRFEPPRPKR